MKITIYELLGLVKDGKAPKKIIYRDIPMIYDNGTEDYIPHQTDKFHGNDLFHYLFEEETKIFLNDTVEILEEQKKIPEKIEFSADGYPIYVSCLDGDDIKHTHANDYDIFIANKINSIIDYLESKGE